MSKSQVNIWECYKKVDGTQGNAKDSETCCGQTQKPRVRHKG